MFTILPGADYEGLYNPGVPLPVFTLREDAEAFLRDHTKPNSLGRPVFRYWENTADYAEIVELETLTPR